ncbi:MAG: polysaccharide deacetylase family protein [Bacteroidales bacterium]|nr:polysaccharide deacetylase family protein [Bacteroidales bacterium]
MKDFIIQPPGFIQNSLKFLHWNFKSLNDVFLTFDDGPTPNVTLEVLDILEFYDVIATFFVIGRNVERHPEIYEKIIQRGMQVGNHTYSHLNGWKTDTSVYINDTKLAGQMIDSNLFRPPYGKIRAVQAVPLYKNYNLIMWDVLTKDYNPNTVPEQCFENVKKYTKNGSIIVFHDSVKAYDNMIYALPRSIEYLKAKGFKLQTHIPHKKTVPSI